VDARGWLLKVLGRHQTGPNPFGEIYVTLAYPGQRRAGHYHRKTWEWFCPVLGRGELMAADGTGAILDRISLDGEAPVVVEVPTGVTHLILNCGDTPLVILAYANRPYDPSDSDTVPVAIQT